MIELLLVQYSFQRKSNKDKANNEASKSPKPHIKHTNLHDKLIQTQTYQAPRRPPPLQQSPPPQLAQALQLPLLPR